MPWAPEPTILEDWGDLRVIVAGQDVTFFRDVPVIIDFYELSDPYGHGPAKLQWPSVTVFDAPGVGEVAWLRPHAAVDIWRADASTGDLLGVPLWSGQIASLNCQGGRWSVHCNSAFAGFLAMQQHQPSIARTYADIGILISHYMTYWSRPFAFEPYEGVPLGIFTDKRGNRDMSRLDRVSSLLEWATAEDGTQQTILPSTTAARTYVLQERDTTTVQWTLHAGLGGQVSNPAIQINLTRDGTTEINRVYGEGITPPNDPEWGGARWRNMRLPNVGVEVAPDYPYTGGGSFGLGTLDADTDTGDGVGVLGIELWTHGYLTYAQLSAANTSGGPLGEYEYTADFVAAVRAVQKNAGITVTGTMTTATWAAVWNQGSGSQNLNSGHFAPLAFDPATEPYLYTPNGSVAGENPAADWSVMRVERHINFGESTRKVDAERLAAAEIARATVPRYYGTIWMTVDFEEGSKFEARAGDNLLLQGFAGDQTMHITGITVNPSANPASITMTVDTHARPQPTVLAQLARDRAVRSDPAYQLSKSRADSTSDALIGWEAELSGRIGRTPLTGDAWNIVKMGAGDAGHLRQLDLLTSPAREFVVLVFGAPVTETWLDNVVGNPLATDFDPTDVDQDALDNKELVEGFGDDGVGDPLGYWPKTKSGGGALTGRGREDGNWSFYSYTGALLWIAIYPSGDCSVTGWVRQQMVEGE